MPTRKDRLYGRIEEHGRKLLKLFPAASVTDPVALSKRARSLERYVHQAQEDDCNGPPRGYRSEAEQEAWEQDIARREALAKKRFARLFGVPLESPYFINGDPRGYALKVKDAFMREHGIDLPRDWVGYGLIAPDLTND